MSQADVQTKHEEEIKPRYDPSVNLTHAGKGRVKGSKNKLTKSAKEVIDKAFIGLGGEKELIAWANKSDKNKGAFYTLIWAKIIPKNIDLQANFTVDIGARLLAARSLQTKIEHQEVPRLIDITDQGKVISNEISKEIDKSVIEEIEEDELDDK